MPCLNNNERIALKPCRSIRSSVFYRLFFPKRSEWVPVFSNIRTSSLSCTSQMSSQLGWM